MKLSTTGSSSPYYHISSFGLLGPVAVLYTAFAHLFTRLRGGNQQQPNNKLAILPPPPPPAGPRIALVTGSNTGIGFETARCLAVEHDCIVILACRSRDKADQAAAKINALAARGRAVVGRPLDLSSFQSVREFAAEVKQNYKQIHILVNNAGRNTSGKSIDDLDLLFQTNFLGHFLLTDLLMDIMAKNARIVNLSSVMHHYCGGADVESVDLWKECAAVTTGSDTYSLSKLAALLFTIELNKRHGNRIRSIAVNPGAVNSDIWRDFPRILIPFFSLIYLTVQQGCWTTVAAAVGDLHAEAFYLQPYWLSGDRSNAPFPAFEMLGPFEGHCISQPRLPIDGGVAAALALWKASEEVIHERS